MMGLEQATYIKCYTVAQHSIVLKKSLSISFDNLNQAAKATNRTGTSFCRQYGQ